MNKIANIREVLIERTGFSVVCYYTFEKIHIDGTLTRIELDDDMMTVHFQRSKKGQ